jgi:hypothetical protein
MPKLSASVSAEHDCSKVLPATFWFRESANNELLLQPRFDFQSIGCSLPGAIDAVFTLSYYAFDAFLFAKVKKCFSFTFYAVPSECLALA